MNPSAARHPSRERTPSRVAAPEGPTAGADPEGHLATGWEPHRPLYDSLLRRFMYAYATSFTRPVALMGGRVMRREPYVTWDRGSAAGLYNGALLLQPLPYVGWDRIVDRLESDLLEGGTGEVILFSPWPTPDLSDRGWRLSGHPPLLLRPAGAAEPPPPTWLEVREVADPRTLGHWEHVAVTGYPLEELQPAVRGRFVDGRILADPRLHAWVGYDDGQPVAIGTSYVVHGLHVPTLGVTLAEFRGRGAWHALMRRRLSTFHALPAVSLFSDHSRLPAEGLGFIPVARWTVWLHGRPDPLASPLGTDLGPRHTAGPGEQPYCPP